MFLILCLWCLYLDICGRTVKLSFLSCGFKGVQQTRAGKTHCCGVVQAAVTYFMASLKLFSYPNVENRLISLSLMLDNDCWAMEIMWRNSEMNKRISKPSQNTRGSENYCKIMAEAVFRSNLFCFFDTRC